MHAYVDRVAMAASKLPMSRDSCLLRFLPLESLPGAAKSFFTYTRPLLFIFPRSYHFDHRDTSKLSYTLCESIKPSLLDTVDVSQRLANA